MPRYERANVLPMISFLYIVIFQCLSYRVTSAAFTSQRLALHPYGVTNTIPSSALASLKLPHRNEAEQSDRRRRDFLRTALAPFIGAAASCLLGDSADAMTTLASDTGTVEMKTFIDPQGLFALKIPKSFFAIRRTTKGDLPDASTGSGRRGSSIFNAGDLAKAEVLAIERFPTRVLLEEYGIDATGSLATFPDIGEPSAIANLIATRRDREKPMAASNGASNTQIVPNSLLISADGRELSFSLRTAIDVQKPELLMEQYGVSTLNRITAAKASLRSNDGYMMAVFASALETDWQGPDGLALQDAVNSFEAIDQANTWPLADKFVMLDSHQNAM